MKRNLETGETAIKPLPAQTADLSISRLSFIHFPHSVHSAYSVVIGAQMIPCTPLSEVAQQRLLGDQIRWSQV